MAKTLSIAPSETFLRRHPTLVGFLLGLAGTLVVMAASMLGLAEGLELKTFDSFVRMSPSVPMSDRIVHIDIDDDSIEALGEFPFVRSRYATVMDLLTKAGAEQIIFDIVFPDPSKPTADRAALAALERLKTVDELRRGIRAAAADHDAIFAAALQRSSRVYLPYTFDTTYVYSAAVEAWHGRAKQVLLSDMEAEPARLAKAIGVKVERVRDIEATLKRRVVREFLDSREDESQLPYDAVCAALIPGYTLGYCSPETALIEAERRRWLAARRVAELAALPASAGQPANLRRERELNAAEWTLMQHVRRSGFVNIEPDTYDGTLRRVRLAVVYNGRVYLQLAAQAALDSLGADMESVEIDARAFRFRVGEETVQIPVDSQGMALVNWAHGATGKWQDTFQHVPFAKIVELGEAGELLESTWRYLDERRFGGDRADALADPHATPETIAAVEDRLSQELAGKLAKGKAMFAKVTDPARAARMRPQIEEIETELRAVAERRARCAALDQWLRDKVAGKTCIIGDTSTSSTDLNPTPVHSRQPGVTLHTNVMNMIFERQFLRRAPGWLNSLLVLLWGTTITIASLRGSAVRNLSLTILLVAANFAVGLLAFSKGHMHVAVRVPLVAQVLSFAAVVTFRQLTEERGKRQIRHAFEHYLSPEVVELVADDPGRLRLGGDMRELTVLFTDIQGFSAVCEGLDPPALVDWLNEYLTEMSETVIESGGVVDKYEGDLIMAFFGAPQDMPDHAARACLAMLENQAKLARLRKDWRARGMPPIYARVGMNTDRVLVGNLGSRTRLNYSVIGDGVNLAARLEPANKVYGTDIMVSEATYEQAKDTVVARELDVIRVVGRAQPVRVYELLGLPGEVDDDTLKALELYAEGLACYRAREWTNAITAFQNAAAQRDGDLPSMTLMARCASYLEAPPPDDWDRVFNLTTKE